MCCNTDELDYSGMILRRAVTLNYLKVAIFLLTGWANGARCAPFDDCSSHEHSDFSLPPRCPRSIVRRFAAMTGVQYEMARHWGVVRHGHPQEFPRWVPLMLEMMDPSVSRKPPNEAVYGHGRDQTTQGIILASLDDPAATLADSRDRSISRRRYTAKDGLDDAD